MVVEACRESCLECRVEGLCGLGCKSDFFRGFRLFSVCCVACSVSVVMVLGVELICFG